MNDAANNKVPDAVLLIAPGCPHCPKMLDALGQMVKEGEIGALQVINLAVHRERAAEFGTRSVPWARIGKLEFEGVHSPAELSAWAKTAGTPEGIATWCDAQLTAGQLGRVEARAHSDPLWLAALLDLLGNEQTSLQVRLGASAILEGADAALLAGYGPRLAELTRHSDHRVRADACHLLSLIDNDLSRKALTACLNDPDQGVREIAAESLAVLAARH
ncbi:MAG: thioredoxin family protein [Pseudomonadota bacterium]|nr:MAG: thioredoxin family protein [Pseudomonadota bacterium]